MNFIVGKANASDGDAIANIVKYSLGSECDSRIVSRKIQSEAEEFVFVAESAGQVIAFIAAELYNPIYYFDCHMNITGLAVDPKFRMGGVAKSLIDALKEYCIENKISGIRVDSNDIRKGAHLFYKSVGFSDEKHQSRFLMKL